MKFLKIIIIGLLILICFLNQYRKNPIGTLQAIVQHPSPNKNYIAEIERVADDFRKFFLKGDAIGYFGNDKILADEDMSSDVVDYYLMQFFFAPTVFVLDDCEKNYILVKSSITNRIKSRCENKDFVEIFQRGDMSLYKLKK